MKVIIAGGTGFIGQFLSQQFKARGHEVRIISRREDQLNWNNVQAIIQALENTNLLINLAGKSVDCRYNEKNKKEILDSRVETTNILGNAILKCNIPPALWINSSTATIYRHAQDRPMTEAAGELGTGFSVDVATSWEKAFFSFALPKTRQVALRTAIVLGKNGGVMQPYKNLVRFGLGGKQGSGEQVFSWIHEQDLFNIISFIYQHHQLSRVFNAAAPNPVNNKTLMRWLRETLGVKIGFPLPVWLLKAGAVLIKTETELVLKSRWVVPEKLVQAGFTFAYPHLKQALSQILTKSR